MAHEDDDDLANNLVATGAIFFVLDTALRDRDGYTVSLSEDGYGNQIDITMDFMRSPYRLTIERVRDE